MDCQQIKSIYTTLLQNAAIFRVIDFKKERTLALKTREKIETAIKEIKEQTTPKEIKELVDQYERQVSVLERVGILEKGKRAIVGIDGVEYPLPSSIKQVLMKEKKKILQKKEQGFGQIRLVPFGMPLETLIEIYKKALLAHHRAGKLSGRAG
jgi:hypothetical protein